MIKQSFKNYVADADDLLEQIESIQMESENISSFNIARKMELAESAVQKSVEFSRAIVSALKELQGVE
jgi:hypothetical protein